MNVTVRFRLRWIRDGMMCEFCWASDGHVAMMALLMVLEVAVHQKMIRLRPGIRHGQVDAGGGWPCQPGGVSLLALRRLTGGSIESTQAALALLQRLNLVHFACEPSCYRLAEPNYAGEACTLAAASLAAHRFLGPNSRWRLRLEDELNVLKAHLVLVAFRNRKRSCARVSRD